MTYATTVKFITDPCWKEGLQAWKSPLNNRLISGHLNVTPATNLAYLTLSFVLARQCAQPQASSRIGSTMDTGPNVVVTSLLVGRPSWDWLLAPKLQSAPSANRNENFE